MLVDVLKRSDGLFLVTEYLDDLLTRQHLLYEAVYLGQPLLLRAEEVSRALTQLGGGHRHRHRHRYAYERQRDAQHDHRGKCGHDGDDR